jgi:2-methylcitrate dehydratase PrpD
MTRRFHIDRLSEYVVTTQFEDIPRSVVEQGKVILLDTLGAIIRAASDRYSAGRMLLQFVKDLGGKKESTIIGPGYKTSAVNAALVNGTMGYYCDIESHHAESITHVAAVLVPTVLALTESNGLGGKELLTSLVVGYDVETRVSTALGPSALYARGFHPSAVAGCFGATSAAGNLLRLSSDQQKMAFGLAGCQASGLMAWETDNTENSRPFQMGIAARNGVTAALLAKKGFGGPPDIFEGRYGIFGAFTDNPQPEKLIEDLGKRFTISEATIKLYSCCAFLHPGADALLSILSKNNLSHADIDGICLRFPKSGAAIIDNNELKSHNAQYILPILAVNREVNIDDILHERRSDREINRLSKNTHVVYDEELGPFPEKYSSVVVVGTKDGKRHSEKVEYAKGHPKNPVTRQELEAKFRRLVSSELSEKRIEDVIRNVDQIEDMNDISELVRLVCK